MDLPQQASLLHVVTPLTFTDKDGTLLLLFITAVAHLFIVQMLKNVFAF